LGRSETIRSQFSDNSREYEEIKTSIKDFFINYRLLNNKEVNGFQLDELARSLEKFDADKLIKLIAL
jgi:hypothetical protein